MVEPHVANVVVASSSLVSRSKKYDNGFYLLVGKRYGTVKDYPTLDNVRELIRTNS